MTLSWTGRFEGLQPGVFSASTVVFPNMAAYRARDWTRKDQFIYGAHGTPTTFELEERVARLEGGQHCLVCPSGLSAIALTYIALLKPGSELLVPVNVYSANRVFITRELVSWGVNVRLYDPTNLASIEFSDATALLWIEAPCSLTFEFPDVVGLTALARSHGVLSALDNTWGAGVALQPFALGVDISVQSLSKYACGTGDVMMGSVSCVDKDLYVAFKLCAMRLGLCVSAGTASAVIKGLDTLRLRYHAQDAATRLLVHELAGHPAIGRILHPAMQDCAGHEFWRRDCSAAAGLFSIEFAHSLSQDDVDRFIDSLQRFKIGYGWGAAKSLVMAYGRSASSVHPLEGELVRLSVGLEAPKDLLADLRQALRQLA